MSTAGGRAHPTNRSRRPPPRRCYDVQVLFDEAELFGAIAESGARALLIGRRAMIARGLPVLTADYDFWLYGDDIEIFNAALRDLDLRPNHVPSEARQRGRYVLENDEHVDVLIARRVSTRDDPPVHVFFDGVWARRDRIVFSPGVMIQTPCLEDLILTKRWSMRKRDIIDIDMLEVLRRGDA
jgi:hypothetical protein